MRRTLLALAIAALVSPAWAREDPRPPVSIFISPSGEPFRPSAEAPDPFEAWFARADADHDGSIDRAEFRADALAFFKVLDVNGDGVIDGFELARYEKEVAPELAAEAEGFGGDGPGRGRGGSRRGHLALLDEPEPVSSADLALDSHITVAEWMQAADRRFDLLDVKKQGVLDHAALATRLPRRPKR
jgi:hypothetical protein